MADGGCAAHPRSRRYRQGLATSVSAGSAHPARFPHGSPTASRLTVNLQVRAGLDSSTSNLRRHRYRFDEQVWSNGNVAHDHSRLLGPLLEDYPYLSADDNSGVPGVCGAAG